MLVAAFIYTTEGGIGEIPENLVQSDTTEEMHQWALEDSITIMGKYHPIILTLLSNLARALQKQGRYEEAEKLHRQALEGRETVLEKDYPDTLASVSDLAIIL